MNKKTIGLVGLGRMGLGLAGQLTSKGYQMVGYDLAPAARERLTELGGQAVTDLAELPGLAEVILLFVLDGSQVLTVVDGLLPACGQSSAIVCLSTIRKSDLEEAARKAADRGVGFLDCPVTGGPARAADGTMALMAAGEPALVDRLRPILEDAGQLNVVGQIPGLGQAVKQCNQLLVTTIQAASMEMLFLAKKLGLDLHQVRDIISSGVAGNTYFDLVATAALDKVPSPCTLGLMNKDSDLVMDTVNSLNLPLFMANAANQYCHAGMAMGLADEEVSEMVQVVAAFAGEKF